jgi:hypothetical protein
VHGADEDDADSDPQDAGQPAELVARQDGPDDGAGGGDRREVLSEQVEGLGRDEVDAVGVGVGRRPGGGVEGLLARDPAPVEPVAEHEGRNDHGGEQGQAHLAAIVV